VFPRWSLSGWMSRLLKPWWTAPPNPYGFMSEFEPTQQIRLRKISQTDLVSQPAEHDVGGKFEVIEWSAVRSLDLRPHPPQRNSE
jgi:hypothetical protein